MKVKVKTKDGFETVEIKKHFSETSFDFITKKSRKRNYQVCSAFGVFDSETSHTEDNLTAWVYQWAFKLGDQIIYGRKPSEFISMLKEIKNILGLSINKYVIIYVHNLSYDFTYLKHYLYEYDNDMSVFAIDTHTYLKIEVNGFVFLCSWKLSNLSLDLFAKSYSEKYLKDTGAIDYNKIRYQDDTLTETDWSYMVSDILSQEDAIKNYLKTLGYESHVKAPITSTGFVRNNCREESRREINWRKKFYNSRLTLEQYNLCNQAFIGGLCIASGRYAGVTVKGEIGHVDFASSYPARQMMDYFPIGKPFAYGDITSQDELNNLLNKYCCVFIAEFENITIKNGVTAPYIPSSKAIHLEEPLKLNGKIVFAKFLSMAMTEIDFGIIKEQYSAESFCIKNMLCFYRGFAPKWMKHEIMKYYADKCNLKKSDPRLYMASKNLLNSIYGMTATKIVREEYDHNGELVLEKSFSKTAMKQIDDYYDSFNSFMPYQFCLYVTGHARRALIDLIQLVGYENFLYCDTDSVFYIKTPDIERKLDAYNNEVKRRASEAGAVYNGHYLGVAEHENDLKTFRALHSKCYAMIDGGELKVTIAGIPKKSIKWIDGKPITKTNAEELGDIDNLRDGFRFSHCGGTRCIYIEQIPEKEKINGHLTEYASAAIIAPIDKVISENMLTVSENYELLKIEKPQIF